MKANELVIGDLVHFYHKDIDTNYKTCIIDTVVKIETINTSDNTCVVSWIEDNIIRHTFFSANFDELSPIVPTSI